MISRDEILRRIRYDKDVQFRGVKEPGHSKVKGFYDLMSKGLNDRFGVSPREAVGVVANYMDQAKHNHDFHDYASYTADHDPDAGLPPKGAKTSEIINAMQKTSYWNEDKTMGHLANFLTNETENGLDEATRHLLAHARATRKQK
jgi:hypothetical protein